MEPIGYESGGSGRLDAVFAALADPTRRAILLPLASGAASGGEPAEPVPLTPPPLSNRLPQPTISKRLRVLERAGLISGTHDAQRRPRRLEPIALAEAEQWLASFRKLWEARYAELDVVLDELAARERPHKRKRMPKEPK